MIYGLTADEVELVCAALRHRRNLDPEAKRQRFQLTVAVSETIAQYQLDRQYGVNPSSLGDKLAALENEQARELILAVRRYLATGARDGLEVASAYLLNSAVIAAGAYGQYRYSAADAGALADYIRTRQPVSRVGYDDTCDVIERLTGYRPIMSRGYSSLEAGDSAMVVRLRYRLANPGSKGSLRAKEPGDYEIALLERLE